MSERKMLDLMQRQAAKRAKMGAFAAMETDELAAIRKLSLKLFGESHKRYRTLDGKYRYGGLLESGPEEPGIVYMGYYIDPPSVPPARRRRQLLFRGAKISEFEEQARLMFGGFQ